MSKMPEKYESDEIRTYEEGEWKSVKDKKARITKYQQIAKQHLKKDKRINIRISEKDLTDLQKAAVSEGLPYQTLIASIIHKYNTGKLVEK
jgi:predicted DNA binding CopG/RHH family protein